jgi:hypothetical protein
MLVGKIGMEFIAEGCYALWVCPNGDQTSRLTRRTTSKLGCFNNSYRMQMSIIVRMTSKIVGDAATDNAPACGCYLCTASE